MLAGTSFADERGDVVGYVGYAEREQVNQGDRRHTEYPYIYYPDETKGFGPGGAFLGGGSGRTEDGYFVVFSNPAVFSQLFAVLWLSTGHRAVLPGRRRQRGSNGVHVRRRRHAGQRRQLSRRDRPGHAQRPAITYNTAPTTALQLPLERTSLFLRGQFEVSRRRPRRTRKRCMPITARRGSWRPRTPASC